MTNNPIIVKWPTQIVTNTGLSPAKTLVVPCHDKPQALYNGVVFVVWMFGVYIFLAGIAKLINPPQNK